MVVLKFGGTSVADADAIARVAGIVARQRTSKVVVVSALAGVTDRLLGSAALAASGDTAGVAAALRDLRHRHLDLLTALVEDRQHAGVQDFVAETFRRLDTVLSAVAGLREPPPRLLDEVAACGELLGSRLVTAVFESVGIPAVWVDARRVIVTDAEHTKAAPALEATSAAAQRELLPHLAAGRVPVLGGFIGATRDGETTTLGRSGSDLSAALLGACLRSREIQIWTDVDGMLTADPRLVGDAQPIWSLSFDEAYELAYFGAKVLHPATIAPAAAHNIPVRILNSRWPDRPGTLVAAGGAHRAPRPAALTCKSRQTLLDITSRPTLRSYEFLARVSETLERFKAEVTVAGLWGRRALVALDEERQIADLASSLAESGDVSCERGLAVLSAVGDILAVDASLAADVIRGLEGFTVRAVSRTPSGRSLCVVLPQEQMAGAMTRLHERFFGDSRAIAARASARAGGYPMRLLIVGHGRMGRLVEALAPSCGFEVVGCLDSSNNASGRWIAGDSFMPADVAVDFSTAAAFVQHFPLLVERRVNVVVGTTGWIEQEAELRRLAAGGEIGVVAAPNFSIGMNLFQLVVEHAATHFGAHAEYGAWIHEAHHALKRDAPSGTALALKSLMQKTGYSREIDVACTRAGHVPGTHAVGFDGLYETVTLTHVTRDRAVFARGALEAARWIPGRRGWFTMRDLLRTGPEPAQLDEYQSTHTGGIFT